MKLKKFLLASSFFCLPTIGAQGDYWMEPEFKQLLEITGLDPKRAVDLDTTVNIVQDSSWVIEGEYFEQHEVPTKLTKHDSKIFHLAKKLGFGNKIEPKAKTYDRAVVLGSNVYHTQNRMNYLLEQTIKHKLNLSKIVLLGSSRDLTLGSKLDRDFVGSLAHEYPRTVYGVMKYTWEKDIAPNMPKSNQKEVLFVNAFPSLANLRDDFKEEVAAWLNQDGFVKGSRVLFVSNQPHASRQHKELLGFMQDRRMEGTVVEVVADEMGGRIESPKVVLDAIRRDLMTIQEQRLKNIRSAANLSLN